MYLKVMDLLCIRLWPSLLIKLPANKNTTKQAPATMILFVYDAVEII